MKNFHVTLRVRNNQLYERRRETGLNQRQFAAEVGISYTVYVELEQLKRQPCSAGGFLFFEASRLCAYHSATPEELWPEEVRAVEHPVLERTFDAAELRELTGSQSSRQLAEPPDKRAEAADVKKALAVGMASLKGREVEILRRRYTENETYDTISKALGISRERVRSIEMKALRKMRHSSRCDLISEASCLDRWWDNKPWLVGS